MCYDRWTNDLIHSVVMRAWGVGFSEAQVFVKEKRPMASPNRGFCGSYISVSFFIWKQGLEPQDKPQEQEETLLLRSVWVLSFFLQTKQC